MKLGIMQPYFFPYIGYWQLMNAVDTYIIYDDVNYIKGGWINRNRVLINGKPKYINLILEGASPNMLIRDVRVRNDSITQRKLLNTLKMNYAKAPYFHEAYPLIESIILFETKSAVEYLEHQIRCIANYLKIDADIILSSRIEKDDLLKGEAKVISICKSMHADTYINAIGGRGLYSFDTFHKNGIELNFLETTDIIYKQYSNEFVPNLSIIDVMMFNSVDKIRKLLHYCRIITRGGANCLDNRFAFSIVASSSCEGRWAA